VAFLSCTGQAGVRLSDRKDYFDKIYRLVKENFYYRDSIDIRTHFNNYRALFLKAPNIDSGYSILTTMMGSLKGKHSGFIPPKVAAAVQQPSHPVFPTGTITRGKVAIMVVPSCFFTQELAVKYVDSMQSVIARLDSYQPIGWILDLQDNNGGSSSAMLAALHCFFENGPILYGHARKGTSAIAIEDGVYKEYIKKKLSFSFQSRKRTMLSTRRPPIVVLTNHATGSAAEVVVIAFKGLSNALIMGTATAGVPTGNVAFTLLDGAVVYITRAVFSDMKGRAYSGPILPDKRISTENRSDMYIEAAGWITEKINGAYR
jgi:C-terminal processing protease CtpA/Prc